MAAGYGNFRWRCGSTACCCKTGSGSGSSSSRVEAACLLHGVELLARVALDGDVPKFPRTVTAHCAPGRRKALHLEPHCAHARCHTTPKKHNLLHHVPAAAPAPAIAGIGHDHGPANAGNAGSCPTGGGIAGAAGELRVKARCSGGQRRRMHGEPPWHACSRRLACGTPWCVHE